MTGAASSVISPTSDKPVAGTIKQYWQLLKPGVMMLVVFTGAIGIVAAPVATTLPTAMLIIFAIAMGSGGGAAINMWYDADIDRMMSRTRKRGIPSGQIAADDVLAIGLALSITGVATLGLLTNWAAAGVLAFAIWFYACFYTMMLKRHTAQNIVIGGAAGAFPPVIGWLSVHPVLTLEPILYFLIVFFWTPPHFWALALYRHEDYANAKIPMLPVVAGERSTLNHIMGYTLALAVIAMLPVILGMATLVYALPALLLNALFICKSWQLCRRPDPKRSMQLFGYSILYLFMLFSALGLDQLFPVRLSWL